VISELQQGLFSGRYAPGDRLPNERELSTMLEVGRSTVREALRALELQGLVDVRPGRNGGLFAAEPTGTNVGAALETLLRFSPPTRAELMEFRVSFEGETAWWAAQRATPDDCSQLDDLADRVRAAAAPEGSWQRIADYDVRFHEGVAAASRNQIRVAIMQAINRPLREVVLAMGTFADATVRAAVAEDLHEITKAIRAADAEHARELMRAHVQRNPALQAYNDDLPLRPDVSPLTNRAER
jgi:DNA-binding FadR family transcriptional regulator